MRGQSIGFQPSCPTAPPPAYLMTPSCLLVFIPNVIHYDFTANSYGQPDGSQIFKPVDAK